MEIGTALWAM